MVYALATIRQAWDRRPGVAGRLELVYNSTMVHGKGYIHGYKVHDSHGVMRKMEKMHLHCVPANTMATARALRCELL